MKIIDGLWGKELEDFIDDNKGCKIQLIDDGNGNAIFRVLIEDEESSASYGGGLR